MEGPQAAISEVRIIPVRPTPSSYLHRIYLIGLLLDLIRPIMESKGASN